MVRLRIVPFVAALLSLPSCLRGQHTLHYDSLAPVFGWITDSVAHLNGLMNERHAPTGPIAREMRLWVGFGLVSPQVMLRIADSAGTLVAQRLIWWRGAEPDYTYLGTAQEREADRRRWQAGVAKIRRSTDRTFHCTAQPHSRHVSTCRLPPLSTPAVRAAWQALDSLNAWQLPDPSQLSPPPSVGLDGISLMVEAWTPRGYRTYDYWEPDHSPWPEAKRASALMRLVYDQFRRH